MEERDPLTQAVAASHDFPLRLCGSNSGEFMTHSRFVVGSDVELEPQRRKDRHVAENPAKETLMEERDPLTQAVIGAAIEVHREMGPGLLESVYQKCMEIELALRGLKVEPQAPLGLVYKGNSVGDDLRMDLFFPNRLVVELKAAERIIPIHEAQLLTYLKLTKTPVGLLINFNVRVLKDGVKRMVLSRVN
jgi:GxxExxY protein